MPHLGGVIRPIIGTSSRVIDYRLRSPVVDVPRWAVCFNISRQAFSHLRHSSVQFFIIGLSLNFSQASPQRLHTSAHAVQIASEKGPVRAVIQAAAAQTVAQSWHVCAVSRCSFFPSATILTQCGGKHRRRGHNRCRLWRNPRSVGNGYGLLSFQAWVFRPPTSLTKGQKRLRSQRFRPVFGRYACDGSCRGKGDSAQVRPGKESELQTRCR